MVNDPHARGIGGRGWGTPRCFRTPPYQGHVPLPRGASERCSTPTPRQEVGAPLHLPPPPCAGAAPQDRAGAGAVAGGGGGGGADSPGAAAAAAAAPRASRGARSAPPPAPGAGPRLLPLHPSFSSEPGCFKAEIARPQRGRRKISWDRGVRDPALFHSGGSRTWDHDPLLPQNPGRGPGRQPLCSETAQSGIPGTSGPRTQGTETPTRSILRPRNPPLPASSSLVPSTAGPRTSSPAV